jgi:asparagine synthase (glutamine-hydrolysing)
VGTKELVQSLVDPLDLRAAIETPFDPRLVGHADDEEPVVVSERKSVPNPPEQLEPFRLSKVVEVGVEGPVAVDEQCPTDGVGLRSVRSGPRHRSAEYRDRIRVHARAPFAGAMEPAVPDLASLRERLSSALKDALRPAQAAPGPLGILFSGGVDSALLAWELRNKPHVVLCTLGRDGSPDLLAGRAGADAFGLPWEGLRVGEGEVRAAEARCGEELAGVPPVSRMVLLSLAIAIGQASPPRLVCGQGVDELFLGYAHYRSLGGPEAEARSREDLLRLRATDWPRTQRIAERSAKEVLAPYLSPAFEESARLVPVDLRLPGDLPKRFFREWAVERGLPPELAARPKKAVQYGSGVDALVRALRRAER